MRLLFAGIAALTLSFGASAQALFQEGVHYTRLAQAQPTETGDKVEVREIFAYGCIHCFHLVPHLAKWEQSAPKTAQLKYMHVAWPQWMHYARAFFALEAMGELKTGHNAIFTAHFTENKPMNDINAVADMLATKGIDKAKFLGTANSFSVNTKLKQAESAVSRYQLAGTPTLIVGGKFKLEFGEKVTMDQVGPLLNFLIDKELTERKAVAKS